MADVGVQINGEEGIDTLWAAGCNEVHNGGAGDDVLFGDKGNDTLTGGAGAGIFEFVLSEPKQTDTIQDYTTEDKLKFYLTRDESELTDSDIVNGNILRGNVTIDLAGIEVSSLADLNIMYDLI